MRRIYSSRELERVCRENLHFMYLLEGHPAPDHNTICRFPSRYLLGHEQGLLAQMTNLLVSWGFVSLEAVFIDGTKIEANANRYSFVWKNGSPDGSDTQEMSISAGTGTATARQTTTRSSCG